MTIQYTCDCGRKLDFRDAAGGRQARCLTCGRVFTVPEAHDVREGAYGMSPTRTRSSDHRAPSMMTDAEEQARADPRGAAADRAVGRRGSRPFWLDVGRSFFLMLRPGNIATIVGYGVLIFFITLPLSIPFYFVVRLLLLAKVAAYFMLVIRSTAGGDDDLPASELWGDFWNDTVLPLVAFFAATLLVLAPAFIVGVWLALRNAPDHLIEQWYWGLGALGVFLWPITILAVSMGGASALIRFDLLLVTIIRTIAPYSVVSALMFALFWIGAVAGGAATLGNPANPPSPGASIAYQGVVSVIAAYTQIVWMRLIGLYYRHYSPRFPWSAG